jgi:PAN domain
MMHGVVVFMAHASDFSPFICNDVFLPFYIHTGAAPVNPPPPTPAPTNQGGIIIECNQTSPNANYPSCGPLKGCDAQNAPLSTTTAAATPAGCISLCSTTSPCKACTYDNITSQCILLRNLTSVAPGGSGEDWSTYIVQTLPRVYPLVNACPVVTSKSPTRVPTNAPGRRRHHRHLVSLDASRHTAAPHHHYPQRSLQSYSGGCQRANGTDVSVLTLEFITPNGSSTFESLAAWQALVSNISSGGSVGPYNSSNICTVNTDPVIIYETGSPTPSPTPSPTSRPSAAPTPSPTPGPTSSPTPAPTPVPTPG